MYTNRVVVITGAAGGVGSVLVNRFLANGDTVIASDASQMALDEWRTGHADDAELLTVAADIASEDDCAGIAGFAQSRQGHVDILINCAGYFPLTPLEEITPAGWRRVVDVNLTGSFLMTAALLPLMKGRGWGRIVNFGSGSVSAGTKGQAHYVSAKAGLVGFTRSAARELGDHGITVNLVTPGLTVTRAVRESFPAAVLAAQREGRALHRDQEPEDLVGPVFFLSSPDADFVTGQTLNVDGGRFFT